jgi:TonB family protein
VLQRPLSILFLIITSTLGCGTALAQEDEKQYLDAVLASTTRKNAAYYRKPIGEKEGLVLATTFTLDGKVKAEGTYVDKQLNIEHGEFVFYHANGKVESKGEYVMGHKAGVWARFDQWGRPLAEKVYDPEPLANIIYTRAQTMPAYPGGEKALVRTINDHMVRPGDKAPKKDALATFVVEKTGDITDIKVLEGQDPAFDQRLADAIRATSPWTPGEEKGQPVRVRIKLPVEF